MFLKAICSFCWFLRHELIRLSGAGWLPAPSTLNLNPCFLSGVGLQQSEAPSNPNWGSCVRTFSFSFLSRWDENTHSKQQSNNRREGRRKGSPTLQKWFLWNHAMTFRDLRSSKVLDDWTGTFFAVDELTHFCHNEVTYERLNSKQLSDNPKFAGLLHRWISWMVRENRQILWMLKISEKTRPENEHFLMIFLFVSQKKSNRKFAGCRQQNKKERHKRDNDRGHIFGQCRTAVLNVLCNVVQVMIATPGSHALTDFTHSWRKFWVFLGLFLSIVKIRRADREEKAICLVVDPPLSTHVPEPTWSEMHCKFHGCSKLSWNEGTRAQLEFVQTRVFSVSAVVNFISLHELIISLSFSQVIIFAWWYCIANYHTITVCLGVSLLFSL